MVYQQQKNDCRPEPERVAQRSGIGGFHERSHRDLLADERPEDEPLPVTSRYHGVEIARLETPMEDDVYCEDDSSPAGAVVLVHEYRVAREIDSTILQPSTWAIGAVLAHLRCEWRMSPMS